MFNKELILERSVFLNENINLHRSVLTVDEFIFDLIVSSSTFV